MDKEEEAVMVDQQEEEDMDMAIEEDMDSIEEDMVDKWEEEDMVDMVDTVHHQEEEVMVMVDIQEEVDMVDHKDDATLIEMLADEWFTSRQTLRQDVKPKVDDLLCYKESLYKTSANGIVDIKKLQDPVKPLDCWHLNPGDEFRYCGTTWFCSRKYIVIIDRDLIFKHNLRIG